MVPSDARGTPGGDWFDAKARVVEANSEEARRANRLLNNKYGLMKRLMEPVLGFRYR